jgi:hypothetical protein
MKNSRPLNLNADTHRLSNLPRNNFSRNRCASCGFVGEPIDYKKLATEDFKKKVNRVHLWQEHDHEDKPEMLFVAICDQCENSGMVSADAPWPWQRFCLCTEQLGYYTLPIRLRACCFGADHRRERVYVLAALQDTYGAGLQRAEREIMAGKIKWRSDANFTGQTGGGYRTQNL